MEKYVTVKFIRVFVTIFVFVGTREILSKNTKLTVFSLLNYKPLRYQTNWTVLFSRQSADKEFEAFAMLLFVPEKIYFEEKRIFSVVVTLYDASHEKYFEFCKSLPQFGVLIS